MREGCGKVKSDTVDELIKGIDAFMDRYEEEHEDYSDDQLRDGIAAEWHAFLKEYNAASGNKPECYLLASKSTTGAELVAAAEGEGFPLTTDAIATLFADAKLENSDDLLVITCENGVFKVQTLGNLHQFFRRKEILFGLFDEWYRRVHGSRDPLAAEHISDSHSGRL